MTKAATVKSIEPYVTGSNSRLDAINNGKTVWIVQGNKGRRPIIANSEDDARTRYLEIDAPVVEAESVAAV